MATRSRFSRQEVLSSITDGTHGLGTNPAVGSTYEFLWSVGSTLNAITAGTQKISSSSAADAAAGTGARTVRVTGMVAGRKTSEDVTLNGQTQVSLTNLYTGPVKITLLTAGSGKVNAGDIYVHTGAVTAGVPDTAGEVYGKMLVGEGQSGAAIATVPTGKRGYVLNWSVSTGLAQDYNGTPDFAWDEGVVQAQLRVLTSAGLTKIIAEAFLSDRAAFNPHPFDLPIALDAGDSVYVVAKVLGTSATPAVTGRVELGIGSI